MAYKQKTFLLLPVLVSTVCPGINGQSPDPGPASETGIYRNVFVDMGIATEKQVDKRINDVIAQLFYGNDDNERIYYETGGDMAYMLDVGNNDIRSEGMSYGMMFCVQLDMKREFDKLWKFAYEYMLNKSGEMEGYFSWHVSPEPPFKRLSTGPAPDGEEYFAMALFMASNRWGDGEGIFNYREEANNILNHMIDHRKLASLGGSRVTNMIDPSHKQIVFVPEGDLARFTDPSYHVPHFYELFALWADNNNDLWREIAEESRSFFRKTCHGKTGLAPDYANFNGSPVFGMGDHHRFEYDAWRVAMNITLDSYWWNKDPWQRDVWVVTYLKFFRSAGVGAYKDQYDINGKNGQGYHSSGLVGMNAMTSLIADEKLAQDFVRDFWNTPLDTGRWRYYNDCLYLFALLNLSGRYRIIGPQQTGN